MTLIDPASRIIHPTVLEALARVGHKGEILVTDALYSTATATRAPVVHLALTAGTPTVTDVVAALTRAIAIEDVCRMSPESGERLPVHGEIDALLPGASHTWVPRTDFYARARGGDVGLCLATGDTRRSANVLLRVGVPELT